MECLQGSRESIQERDTAACIRKGVYRRHKKVETQSPVCEDGEVAEALFRFETANGRELASPDQYEDAGEEGV